MVKKIPKKMADFKVFGENIPVKIVYIEDAGGHYYPDEKRIELDSETDPAQFQRVMVHELLHAAFDRVSLTAAISPDLEEVVVDTLSKVIVENFDLKRKKLK